MLDDRATDCNYNIFNIGTLSAETNIENDAPTKIASMLWPTTVNFNRTCSDGINEAFILSPFKINDEKEKMMKMVRKLAVATAIVAMACGSAMATPSTQIYIPSTDAKDFKNIHIDIDNYARFSSKPDALTNIYNVGLSAGVLPLDNLKLEVGVDFLKQDSKVYDDHPFYFNAKLATPEGAFGIKELPAFAVGGMNFSTVTSDLTQQNIVYGLVAKTLPVVGRLSLGGYNGSKRVLSPDPLGKGNTGMMASLDRSMPEISDKLWLAVDYMSGKNLNGEISVGGSWTFSKQISLIVGAVFFNPFQSTVGGVFPGGKPALTTQIDISLP